MQWCEAESMSVRAADPAAWVTAILLRKVLVLNQCVTHITIKRKAPVSQKFFLWSTLPFLPHLLSFLTSKHAQGPSSSPVHFSQTWLPAYEDKTKGEAGVFQILVPVWMLPDQGHRLESLQNHQEEGSRWHLVEAQLTTMWQMRTRSTRQDRQDRLASCSYEAESHSGVIPKSVWAGETAEMS